MRKFPGLMVLLFLQSALGAQEPNRLSVNPGAIADAAPAMANLSFQTSSQTPANSNQTPPAKPIQKPKHPAKAEPAKQLKRAKIEGSMVGYIEPAPVENDVRIRFVAGCYDPRPDRAEYFYAGSNAPAASTSAVQRTLNFQELYLYGEYAPLSRFSGFVQIPFRWIQPSFVPDTGQPSLSSGGGISDVQAGMKLAAVTSPARNLTFQLRAYFPTGNGAAGMGTNHYSIEPKVLFLQRLSDRVAIEAEAGDTHPIGGTIYYATSSSPGQTFSADVAMYGVGPSYELIKRDSYRLTPIFELVSWHVFGGLQTGSTSVVQSAAGINVLNAKLGARASFADGSSIYAGFGRGITSDIWYRNLFRIEYRRVF